MGAFAIAGLSATASAQLFSDGFDTYPLGPLEGQINPSGAFWKGWGGITTNLSLVSNTVSSSSPNSAELQFGCDTVIEFDDMTAGNPMNAGQWTLTVEAYVTGNFDGRTYFIGMNTYDGVVGTYEWAIQLAMDSTGPTPSFVCDCGTAGSQSWPLTPDQWELLQWDIDFDADWVDFSVNGNLVAGYEWSKGVFGGDNYASIQFDAVDLFPEFPATVGEVYLDNLQIVDASAGPPGVAYCPGDGSGTQCPCVNNSTGPGGCDWGDAAFPGGGFLDGAGTASIGANDLNLTASGISNNFGIFFGAANQVNGGAGNPLNDGLRCAGGALVRLIPPTMAAGNSATTPSPVATLDTGAAAGVTRRYQYWFRTPAGPCGNQANLTNGYEVVWLP